MAQAFQLKLSVKGNAYKTSIEVAAIEHIYHNCAATMLTACASNLGIGEITATALTQELLIIIIKYY